MMTNNLLRKALLKTKLRSSEGNVYLRSDKYMALGCNLKFLEVLESDLRNELNLSSSSILFVAEVSVTYMPTTLADSVIRWASTLNDGTLIWQYTASLI
jgi:tRNA wybutosine-synthesizing protein 4